MQLGRYKIVEKLGEGGMGEVYRALALGIDGFKKPVVIKRIHRHLSAREDLLQRFINEAKIAMGMTHGNVVQVLELGKVDSEYFIAMEYVDGRDLRDLIVRCMELEEWVPQEIALLVVTETLRGLDYAHRRADDRGVPLGIVHRDITPANILISFEGEVKLSDFGIARAARAWSHLTQAGTIRGSVNYMSPEQASGETVDQRSDIFSMGSVLYLLLCNALPFPGQELDKVLPAVQSAEFLAPSARGVELPEPLETIVLTAMARDPDDRYPSAAAMRAALEEHQRTVPHATQSDLQAYVQRLFEHELDGREVMQAGDLVGAELAAAADATPGSELSHYSLSLAPAHEPDAGQGSSAAAAPAPSTTAEDDDPVEQAFRPRPWRRWVVIGAAAALALALALVGLALVVAPTDGGPGGAPGAILVVRTDPPGATVSLDGDPLPGTSPVVAQNLEFGREYTVRARLKHHTGPPEQVRLQEPTTNVSIKLWRTAGRLEVVTSPAGATVTVDGTPRGKSPVVVAVPLGRPTEVAAQLDGHVPASRQIELSREAPEQSITLELRAHR